MRWFRSKKLIRSFAEDAAGMGALNTSYGGAQTIPVDRIVGTASRAHELGPNFMPILKPFGDDRFKAIRARMEQGKSIPPIVVSKLCGRYYVVDGHHRVAAARKIGQLELDAVVTEYRPVAAAQAA